MKRRAMAVLVAVSCWACGKPAPAREGGTNDVPPSEEPPVALNPSPPIQYPPRLFDQRVEGEVVLRLFIDSTGRLVPESTRVAESSGYTGLDSAAVAGASRLRYAPAKRHGIAVSTLFLQPIQFRHSQASAQPGAPAAPGAIVPEPLPITRPPVRRAAPPRADTTRRDTTTRRDSTARRDTTPKPVTDTGPPAPAPAR